MLLQERNVDKMLKRVIDLIVDVQNLKIEKIEDYLNEYSCLSNKAVPGCHREISRRRRVIEAFFKFLKPHGYEG